MAKPKTTRIPVTAVRVGDLITGFAGPILVHTITREGRRQILFHGHDPQTLRTCQVGYRDDQYVHRYPGA